MLEFTRLLEKIQIPKAFYKLKFKSAAGKEAALEALKLRDWDALAPLFLLNDFPLESLVALADEVGEGDFYPEDWRERNLNKKPIEQDDEEGEVEDWLAHLPRPQQKLAARYEPDDRNPLRFFILSDGSFAEMNVTGEHDLDAADAGTSSSEVLHSGAIRGRFDSGEGVALERDVDAGISEEQIDTIWKLILKKKDKSRDLMLDFSKKEQVISSYVIPIDVVIKQRDQVQSILRSQGEIGSKYRFLNEPRKEKQ